MPDPSAWSKPVCRGARGVERTSRRRTVYSITVPGRAALARLVGIDPARASAYESEALMKVLFAENGTMADLLAAMQGNCREDATATSGPTSWRSPIDMRPIKATIRPVCTGAGLAARFLSNKQSATLRWAAWAERRRLSRPQPTVMSLTPFVLWASCITRCRCHDPL